MTNVINPSSFDELRQETKGELKVKNEDKNEDKTEDDIKISFKILELKSFSTLASSEQWSFEHV